MKPDGVEAPVTPVLAIRSRRSDQVPIVALAAFALVVIGAGFGLVGNGIASPVGSPDGLTGSHGPSPSPSPRPAATPSQACLALPAGATPEIRLGVVGDVPPAVLGASSSNPGNTGTEPAAWPALALDGPSSIIRPLATLTIGADQNACLGLVAVDYLPADPAISVRFPIAFRRIDLRSARASTVLGSLPAGDWIVRITAQFATGAASGTGGALAERFFRVASTSDPLPLPTPIEPPMAPCQAPPANGDPAILLVSSSQGVIQGSMDGADPPLVPVRLRDSLEVRVAGDVCALAWNLEATGAGGGAGFGQESNELNDPFLYTQNRWTLHDLQTGRSMLTATLRFSADVIVEGQWLIDVVGETVPTARIVGPDGAAVTPARAPCGASWTFTSGVGGWETCTYDPIPLEIPTLTVEPESQVRVEVPGWVVIGWGGQCGQADTTTTPGTFVTRDSCDLGGWYAPDGVNPAGRPAVFLPRTTGSLTRIWVGATRGGETIWQSVYVHIAVAPGS
ncbi:MAG: hypothetical protein ABIZ30_09970 [Candidatus Limnocylindrales bacterium]